MHMQFQDVSHMVELSILQGNDYTSPYLDDPMKKKLQLRSLDDISRMIRNHGKVECVPAFKEELVSTFEFCQFHTITHYLEFSLIS